MQSEQRLVLGSPVHKDPAILREFLHGVRELDSEGLDVEYVLIDDNEDPESSALLREFSAQVPGVTVVVPASKPEAYLCDEVTHHWEDALVWRVAAFKDAIIGHALEKGHDWLFLVDSDLVLQPGTLPHLVSLRRDIVSEVFWTRWTPDGPELPQVWLRDVYDMTPRARGEELSSDEAARRVAELLRSYRTPGVYEVGGLGACTLMSRAALERGVCFQEIPNLSFWGEDRHFCVRAAALGLTLWADTALPPLHLYRESDLARVPAFAASCGLSPSSALTSASPST